MFAGVQLCPQAPLKPGDGVVFDAGKPEGKEEGGTIFSLQDSRGLVMPATRVAQVAVGVSVAAAAAGSAESEVQLVFDTGAVSLKDVKVGMQSLPMHALCRASLGSDHTYREPRPVRNCCPVSTRCGPWSLFELCSQANMGEAHPGHDGPGKGSGLHACMFLLQHVCPTRY